MVSPEERLSRGHTAQAITQAVVRVVRDYTGRGPTQAHTTITDDVIIVVLRDTLLKAERRLVDDGQSQAVRDMRRRFQSANVVDPDVAVEVFVLGPRGEA